MEKVKLIYEVGEDYISNDGSEYAENCVDLQGIKRYNIFRYFEDINMLLPVATEFDVENNTLYAETDELGTYCVLDMEVLLENFGIAPDGMQTATVEKKLYSGSGAGYNVTFIIDIRSDYISMEQFEQIKSEICNFMLNAEEYGENITVNIYTQTATDSGDGGCELVGHFKTESDLKEALDDIALDDCDDAGFKICDITDGLEMYSYQSLGSKNYIFDVFSHNNAYFDAESYKNIESNAYHTGVSISIITDTYAIEYAQSRLPKATGGSIICDFNDFGEKVYNLVFDSKKIETAPYSVILSTDLQTVALDSKLYPKGTNPYGEDSDTDDDGKADWDEVNWGYVEEYWAENGLADISERPFVVMDDMPTIRYCMEYESEKSGAFYVEDSLQRLMSSNIASSFYNYKILPILSSPVDADSDGDGITDGSVLIGNAKYIEDDRPLKYSFKYYDSEIQKLKTIYPNAEFEFYKISVEMSDFIDAQYYFDNPTPKAEDYTKYGSANKYLETDINIINARIDKGETLWDGNFFLATYEGVEYYIKVDSYFTKENIFAFLALSGGYQTYSLEDAEFMLEGTYFDSYSGFLNANAQSFFKVAKDEGIDLSFIITKSIMESNAGTKGSCNELCAGTTINGVTYYNVYGYGAVDGSAEESGSSTAKSEGWTSLDMAIQEGAKVIKNKYLISQYDQDTLYEQRFNIVRYAIDQQFYPQYSSNISMAYDQAKKMYSYYYKYNPNAKMLFKIPIFEVIYEN